ncbi:glycosyltransferase family protein [Helicobacter equorum]|uniref:glycosyltransferase n=1 Tax=Helicobacter equorum TaxID=361872 RepID=UPI000CF0EF22|nr:glycosyltransferase [Helicobacter equorum]
MLAPIVLFTYNRVNHTKQVIESLIQNALSPQSDLIIYSDAPKNTEATQQVKAVREYLINLKNLIMQQGGGQFKSIVIIERPYNFGLADSIIDGVTTTMNKYGKAIILEDDIVVSPVFLDYMNDALNRYQAQTKVWSINAWSYPIDSHGLGDSYFWSIPHCWGWGSWGDRWQYFKRDIQWVEQNFNKEDMNAINLYGSANYFRDFILNKQGKIKSWAIFNYLIAYKHNALSLAPSMSYVYQIGFDGSGVHCGEEGSVLNPSTINTKFPISYPTEVKISHLAFERICAFEKSLKKPLYARIKNKLLRIFKKLLATT